MSWRKIQKEDIKRGTVIRMTKMIEGGSYGMATIICTREAEAPGYPNVKVARPYAYAHEHFDTNQPLVGSEVFSIGMDRILDPKGDYEVFQMRDDIHTMKT
jgi:hypothetical protein